MLKMNRKQTFVCALGLAVTLAYTTGTTCGEPQYETCHSSQYVIYPLTTEYVSEQLTAAAQLLNTYHSVAGAYEVEIMEIQDQAGKPLPESSERPLGYYLRCKTLRTILGNKIDDPLLGYIVTRRPVQGFNDVLGRRKACSWVCPAVGLRLIIVGTKTGRGAVATFDSTAVLPTNYNGQDMSQLLQELLAYYPAGTHDTMAANLARMIESKNPVIANCGLYLTPAVVRSVMFSLPSELEAMKIAPARFCQALIDSSNKQEGILDEVLLDRLYESLETNVLGVGYVNMPSARQRIPVAPEDVVSMVRMTGTNTGKTLKRKLRFVQSAQETLASQLSQTQKADIHDKLTALTKAVAASNRPEKLKNGVTH